MKKFIKIPIEKEGRIKKFKLGNKIDRVILGSTIFLINTHKCEYRIIPKNERIIIKDKIGNEPFILARINQEGKIIEVDFFKKIIKEYYDNEKRIYILVDVSFDDVIIERYRYVKYIEGKIMDDKVYKIRIIDKNTKSLIREIHTNTYIKEIGYERKISQVVKK